MSGNSVLRGGTPATGEPQSQSGDILLNATEAIAIDSSFVNNSVEIGNAGDIAISTGNLSLNNDAQINSSTRGIGDAGNITVNAKDRVSLINTSYIFSTVNAGGVGNGGQIKINTGNLTLKEGATILTNVLRNVDNLAAGEGNAGSITVNARDTITIDGTSNDDGFPSGLGSELNPGAKGKAGNLKINADSIFLTNGAGLSSQSEGFGDAGNITITANSLTLDRGKIFASNAPSESIAPNEDRSISGGNITINFKDILQLRNDSEITAGASGNANGGNININAPDGFIVASPNQDNKPVVK